MTLGRWPGWSYFRCKIVGFIGLELYLICFKVVCDDFFDINDGDVFCKMLGYTNGAETVYLQSHFGHSNLSYHLDDLQCTGEEESFLDCHILYRNTDLIPLFLLARYLDFNIFQTFGPFVC